MLNSITKLLVSFTCGLQYTTLSQSLPNNVANNTPIFLDDFILENEVLNPNVALEKKNITNAKLLEDEEVINSSITDTIIDKMLLLISDSYLDFDEINPLDPVLEDIRLNKTELYKKILAEVRIKEISKLADFILLYLTKYDFDEIFSFEYQFILYYLKFGDLSDQEIALNNLFGWTKFNNFSELKKQNINIKNIFLQKELMKLIEEGN